MKQEIINILRNLDSEIVDSYEKETKQVSLKISPEIFNQIARQLE